MTFQEFTEQLKYFLVHDFGYGEDKLKLLPKGYASSRGPEINLIRDTNLRYFNKESDTLLGNFLFINYRRFDADGGSSAINPPKDHYNDHCTHDDQSAHDNVQKDQERHDDQEGNRPVLTFERLHLDSMYIDCQENGFESVLSHLRKTRSEVHMAEETDTLDHMDDYQRTKESLIIRPVNFNAHRRTLKGNVYRRVGDIALVLYFHLSHDESRYMSGRVPREAFLNWGITEDDVIKAALENTERIHPATVAMIVHTPFKQIMVSAYKPMGLLRELTEDITNAKMLSLSGKNNPNGAVSLFFPGVQKLLFERIGGPYLVAFIGLDGAVIHSVDQVDAKTVLASLNDTNTQYNRPEDILSSHVYKYDGKSLEIVRV